MQPKTPINFLNKMQSGLVSACIVTRNSSASLKCYLDSLVRSLGNVAELEIIVIDNESSDDTEAMLKQNFPQAQYIFHQPGIGFTKAINTAVALSKGEYILIATPSTEIIGYAIPHLLNYLEKHEDVGIVGPKVLHPDGTTQHSSKKMPSPKVALLHTLYLFGLIRSSKILNEYFLFNYESDEPVKVDSLTMSLMLVRRAVFESIGFMDENLFVWSSDVDWCYQVEKSPWKQYFLPKAKVFHRRNSVSKKQPFNNLLLYHKDLSFFYQKHFSKNNNLLTNLLWSLMLQARLIFLAVRYFFVLTDDFSYY